MRLHEIMPLTEGAVRQIQSRRGTKFKVFIDPSPVQFKAALGAHEELRALVDQDGRLYVWDAFVAMHADVFHGMAIEGVESQIIVKPVGDDALEVEWYDVGDQEWSPSEVPAFLRAAKGFMLTFTGSGGKPIDNRGAPVQESTLAEKVAPGYLYHACDLNAAVAILDANALEARTTHRVSRGGMSVGFRPADADKFGTVAGVSLTRDPHFARAWRREGVVFVIDAARLRQRHRMVPLDYYGKRREAEEFVIGPIRNLDAFLVEVQIGAESLAWANDQNAEYIEGHEPYLILTQCPKLKVVGQSWQDVTGRVLAK